MYYQNGNYMQDLNYYNQNPNYGYNPYQNMNGQMPQMHQQNLTAMYPAVYRIISPVVSQVLANNNTGYMTEDILNKMVDNVYNIVERDINLEDNSNSVAPAQTSESQNMSNCERNPARSSANSVPASNMQNKPNTLLRDLIKIMLLNEIVSRRQNNNFQMMQPNNMQGMNMNQPMFI